MYYMIYGLNNEVSEITHSHKYGVYFSTFDNHKNYMLQSGQRDSLKFLSLDEANKFLEIAKEYFKTYTFYVVCTSKLTLGIDYHRFVYENGTITHYIDSSNFAKQHTVK